jgi:hypothetical protein
MDMVPSFRQFVAEPDPSPGFGSAHEVFLPFKVFPEVRNRIFGSPVPLFAFLRIQGFPEIRLSKTD